MRAAVGDGIVVRGHHRPHPRDHVPRLPVLQQVAGGPPLDGSEHVLSLRHRREHDHRSPRTSGTDPPDRLNGIAPREPAVQEYHIRGEGSGRCEHLCN